MDKRTVIYYTDELNDEFSIAEITPRKIDENYVYIHTSLFKRFTHFFWYRIIATPIAFFYVKLVFGHRTKGREKLKKHRRDGYYLFGNHTQDIGDAFIPNMSTFNKTVYMVVHPNNVSMPVLGKVTPSLGAIPIPEGHIWPYYTKIRNFPDTSFAYPAKKGTPVYCFTNTYHKRRVFRHPRIITYIDGPFYPDMDLPMKARKKELRDMVYNCMCKRAELSTHVQIRYIKQEKNQ